MGWYSHRFTIILIHQKNHGSNTCYSNIRKLGSGSMSFDWGGPQTFTKCDLLDNNSATTKRILGFHGHFVDQFLDILPVTSPFFSFVLCPQQIKPIF